MKLIVLTVLAALSGAAQAQIAPTPAKPAPAPAPSAAPPAAVATPAPAADKLFIVHFTTGPGWAKDKSPGDQAGFREYSQNLARLRASGQLQIGARYKDATADKGMIVLRAPSIEAARAEFANDPMVKANAFRLDVAEFAVFYEGVVSKPAAVSPAAPDPLDGFNWLAGCWAGKLGRREFKEQWMKPAGGLMLGMGRTLQEGKVMSHEAMRIEIGPEGKAVFIAKPSGQPEGSFTSIKEEQGFVIFENLKHDFPQRVRYEIGRDGKLTARIEGTMNGRDARAEFPMSRVACD